MEIDPNILDNDRLWATDVEPELDEVGIHTSPQGERGMKTCSKMKKCYMTPKTFRSSLLRSSNQETVTEIYLWVSKTGWPSTVKTPGQVVVLACKVSLGLKMWKFWIFYQAQEIVYWLKLPQQTKELGLHKFF